VTFTRQHDANGIQGKTISLIEQTFVDGVTVRVDSHYYTIEEAKLIVAVLEIALREAGEQRAR